MPLLDRKALPQLGTATDAKLLLDQRAAEAAGGFEAAARAEKARREAAGIGDSHAERQPPVAPSVAAGTIVAGTRLEVLCHYNFAMAVEAGQMGNRDIIRIVVVLAARRDISYPDRQTVSPTPIRIVPHSSYSPLLTSILSTLNKRF